ncbi:MAG: uncharacterized protein JWO08_4717, partial [Verrucomicrobiaceae bacterium]|nr:uncharacterized protein [Verrucomicrobiaceae bacterium]
GTGTLTLTNLVPTNVNAGNNTFTGGSTLNQGVLTVQHPLALGTGAVNLVGGTLNLNSNGSGANGTIILGDQTGAGSTVNIRGPVTVGVNNNGANSGNVWQVGALNLTDNTLTVSGGNNYRLRVAGPTQILGGYANIANSTDVSALILDGVISGTGALNKTGSTFNQRVLTINGTANTYSGGTNIVAGMVQVTGNSGNPLGTGMVKVFAGGNLRIAGNLSLGAATLQTSSRPIAMGMVSLDNDFNPTVLTAANFSSIYGVVLGLNQPFTTTPLDMASIGDGKAFLGGGIGGVEAAYIAPTLGAGLADAAVPGTPVYRLGVGGTFAFTGADNVLTGNAFVQVGNPLANSGTTPTLGAASVIIRNSNNFTGGVSIAKGSAVTIDTGSAPGGSTPLGSANGLLTGAATDVEIFGTLSTGSPAGFNGIASYVNVATGKNANNYILRPGGLITVTDIAGTPPGLQGRWADTDANGGALNLNGGTFRFTGAANFQSSETMGTITVSKNAGINVVRNASAGSATLVLGALTRTAGGTLSITDTAFTLGIPLPLNTDASGATTNASATVTVTSTSGYVVGQVITGANIPANATIIAIPNGTTLTLSANATATATGTTITRGTTIVPTNFERLVVTGGPASLGGLTGNTNNGAGVVNGGILAPWMVDATNNTFVGYNVTGAGSGFQPLLGTVTPDAGQIAYSVPAASGALGVAALDTVDVRGSITSLTGNAQTAYAMRIATANATVSNGATTSTLTLTSGGLIFNAAGIVIDPVITNAPLPQMTLAFGTEAFIYTGAAATNAVINATITTGANGLTKFGSGLLQIQSVNPGLAGPVTLNAGTLTLVNTLGANGVSLNGTANNQNITLNGGTLNIDGLLGNAANSASNSLASNVRATTNLGSNITFAGDATLNNNSQAVFQRINNLTIADISGSNARSAVTATINTGIYVAGTTTLGAGFNNFVVPFNQFSSAVLGGKVSGGTLVKFSNGGLLLASGDNDYSATVINGHNVVDSSAATSIVGSLTRTGTPFGSGPITVNPGGMLRIADPSNITGNQVNLISDGSGLAGIAVAYNGALPAFGTGAGQLNFTSTGAFKGVLALDINAYTTALDMAAIGGGNMWLGTSTGSIYFAQTLGASGGVYRLGGGGNQGVLQIGGGSNTVGIFENVLTGANVEIGAMISGINANGSFYNNGNIGNVSLNNRNLGLTGYVSANAGTLAINNAFALGNSVLRLNGGNLSFNNFVSIANNVDFIGDTFATTGGDSASIMGNVNLAPNGAGGTRTFNIGGGNHFAINGVISGGAGSNIIKTGGSTLALNGMNTFQGTTTVNQGFLTVGTNVLPNVNGALGNSATPVLFGNVGGNSAGQFAIAGQYTFARDMIFQAISGTGVFTLRGQTLNSELMTGGIFITSGQTVQIDSTQGNAATFRGGLFDIQGIISGSGGIVQIGNTGVQGTVRLSANSNGLGTNTYSGGTSLQAGRLQVAADAYYTGTTGAPTIFSGPLGTGTLTFGGGAAGLGGAIEAYGADRTIINALGTWAGAQTQTTTFTGHNNLTFTRDLNISAEAALQIRNFAVLQTQGVTTFSGNLSNTSALGSNLFKLGGGTLVLSGTNTQGNLKTDDVNYGTTVALTAGMLSVNADANLGVATVATVGTGNYAKDGAGTTLNHAAGSASDIRLRGGVLQVTGAGFTTSRSLILGTPLADAVASSSGIDVPTGTFTVSNPLLVQTTAPTSITLTKTGAGTLALNGSTTASPIGSLIIGGQPLATALNQFSGASGGTVSTTAISGNPFVSAAGSITINGGTLSLVGGGTAQALTVAAISFAGGSYIQLNKASTGSALTATALTRSGQGTLTIVPSAIANLGTGVSATGENLITSTAYANTGGILTVPAVYIRLAGVGQPANFAQYGANGFTLNSATSTTLVDGTAATSTLLDLPSSATPYTLLGSTVTYNAVRTSANIAPVSGSLLAITSGGLILNPNTNAAPSPNAAGVNISSNVAFGSAATAAEALVYVADGTAAAAPAT